MKVRKLVVASGKGGVGKSMLASSLALLFSSKSKVIACDCDVDAPNLGLWLGVTEWDLSRKISTSEKAFINKKICSKCGKCYGCVFNAIERKNDGFEVNPFLCEGCGYCALVCPEKAIEIRSVKNGEIRVNTSKYNFPVISGKLYPGEAGSGKVVEELKREVEKYDYELAIFDSAAGIGCPVIASIKGSDFALLVTEPTHSGLADLHRVIKLVEHFSIPYAIVINKWDIAPEMSEQIEEEFKNEIIGRIPYDRKVVESLTELKPVINSNSIAALEIKKIFNKLSKIIFKF